MLDFLIAPSVNESQITNSANALIEINAVESVFKLRDFDAHPGVPFAIELVDFCSQKPWLCADIDMLPVYTFVSEAHRYRRWLDHCLLSRAARLIVVAASVLYGVY